MTWAARIDPNTSKACCVPGSSAYVTSDFDAARSRSTKHRASFTGASESLRPCSTKKAGASGPGQAHRRRLHKSSGASPSLLDGALQEVLGPLLARHVPASLMKSYTP